MRIAIVGTGISGLVAAHLLHEHHDLTIYEANNYIGGHTNTIDVPDNGQSLAVDTGFIVFNTWTYPNFCKLLDKLDVASQSSDMSFSVKCDLTGLEYNGGSFSGLFAQRGNLVSPRFLSLCRDILRFNRRAKALVEGPLDDAPLADFLRAERFSDYFVAKFLIPMGSAIWSADPKRFMEFPARTLFQFLNNHGMLNIWHRPQWRVVRGGSREYVRAIVRPFENRIRLQCPVTRITRFSDGVEISAGSGKSERFDAVIIAAHSDQALRMLADPSDAERQILASIPYQANQTLLHTDVSVLPRLRRAWASWNYHIGRDQQAAATMTYNMNVLQSLTSDKTYCVTLNENDRVNPSEIVHSIAYHHPVFTPSGVAAQRRHGEINGVRRTYFCGAYWGYGFHEDGVKSALAVCRHFGRSL